MQSTKMGKTQRCLFERPTEQDRQQAGEKLEARLKERLVIKSKEYNFDFLTSLPLEGGNYEWEKISKPSPLVKFRESRTIPSDLRCEPARPVWSQQNVINHQYANTRLTASSTDPVIRPIIVPTITDHSRLQGDDFDTTDQLELTTTVRKIRPNQCFINKSIDPLVMKCGKRSRITDYYSVVKRQKKT